MREPFRPTVWWRLDKISEMTRRAAFESAQSGETANLAAQRKLDLNNRIFFGVLVGVLAIVIVLTTIIRTRASRKKQAFRLSMR